jgi:hypothetical protein
MYFDGDTRPSAWIEGASSSMARQGYDYYEKLLGVAKRIIGHVTLLGRHETVERCLEEVGDLIAAGRITADRGAVLAGILAYACPPVA